MPDASTPTGGREGQPSQGVVLIGDVVSSRDHPDRPALQARLRGALERANRSERVTQPLHIQLGDEFQGVVATLADALRVGLDVRLDLLPDVELRVGVGVGPFWVFDAEATPISQDGPAWWAARRAIESAKDLGGRPGTRHVRSWAVALGEDGREADGTGSVPFATVNAYLGLQDFVLASMRPRHLRLLVAALRGEPQREVARREGITQSAVSQALSSSGAQALAQALATLSGGVSAEVSAPG